MPFIKFKEKKIEYTKKGNGKAIVFLHGYLESSIVWEQVENYLSKNYTTISIDLPGHGNSELIEEIETMELMAETINEVLENEKISEATIIGHSMGGYVALEFYSKYTNKVSGLCLFHSTPFADDQQRKEYRSQVIELIKAGKHITLAKEHVEKTFAKSNLEKFQQEIGFLKVVAVNTKPQTAIATLEGMKIRKDHSKTFENISKKALWILGTEDNFIPIDVTSKVQLPKNVKVQKLEKVGHQGHIENFTKTIEILTEFINL